MYNEQLLHIEVIFMHTFCHMNVLISNAAQYTY